MINIITFWRSENFCSLKIPQLLLYKSKLLINLAQIFIYVFYIIIVYIYIRQNENLKIAIKKLLIINHC